MSDEADSPYRDVLENLELWRNGEYDLASLDQFEEWLDRDVAADMALGASDADEWRALKEE